MASKDANYIEIFATTKKTEVQVDPAQEGESPEATTDPGVSRQEASWSARHLTILYCGQQRPGRGSGAAAARGECRGPPGLADL